MKRQKISTFEILSLSITLMCIGIFSFVAPILGRQFILVTALNAITGSAFNSGLLFLCTGGILFYYCMILEKRELAATASFRAASQSNDIQHHGKISKGAFVFPEVNIMSAFTYGYWSVKWTEESAIQLQETIKNSNFGNSCSYMQTNLTFLQLMSIQTASYFVFAVLLGVLPEHIEEMKKGVRVRLKEAKYEIDNYENENELFENFLQRYFRAIYDDVKIDNVDSKAINFDISKLEKTFIESLEHYNFKNDEKIGAIERLFIGNIIADYPICVFEGLRAQGVYFDTELIPKT